MKIDLHFNVEFAKLAEGAVIKDGKHYPYQCPADYLTIGYGWNLDAHELPLFVKKELLTRYIAELSDIESAGTLISATYGIGENGLPDDLAKKMLRLQLQVSESELMDNIDFWPELDFVRRQVLIDMCFNIGWTRLSGFKRMFANLEQALKLPTEDAWQAVVDEMIDSKWHNDVKNRALYLEKSMLTGEWVEYN